MRMPMDRSLPLAPHPVRARRARSGLLVRLVYGAGVLAVASYFAWYFGREFLFLEGAGTVTAPVYDVSTAYLSQVVHMNVASGVAVEKGDLIATLKSPQIEREVDDLDRLLVEQSQKEADLKIRLRVSAATVDLLRKNVELADEAFSRLDPSNSGVTSLSYRMDVYRERSAAGLQLAQAEAEAAEVRKQLDLFAANRRDIRIRKHELLAAFDEGHVKAQVDGIIGTDVVHVGEVIKPGDRIAEIYDVSEAYILWHLPPFSLREPQVAEEVYVHYGSEVLPAYVYEIQQIAQQAPGINQSLLREKPQQQVVLVRPMPGQRQLPINAQVTVRMNYSDLLEAMASRLFGPGK